MLCHQTGDILLIKMLLGHKKIENTMKYTQPIQFRDDEYNVATATNVREAKVPASGFDYVTEKNGRMLSRKPEVRELMGGNVTLKRKECRPKTLSVNDSAICVVKIQGVERIWQLKDFQVLGSQLMPK